jgi:hypothetical protein
MATSRSIPRMMQMTTAAFQAVVNLNQQATDPKAIPRQKLLYWFPVGPATR